MKRFKKILIWTGAVFLLIALAGATFYFVYLRPVLKKLEETSIIKYEPEFTVILGGGGNSGILASDSLVIVVDTKMGDEAEAFAKTVHEIAGNKPIFVINTHYHFDHTTGNKYFKGQTILAGGNYTKENWIDNSGTEGIPTLWLKDRMDIRMGNETVTLLNMPRHAHTESDVFVYLHQHKLLFGGDVILNHQIPSITGGGVSDPEGYLAGYDLVTKEFDVQKIVPGHGPAGGTEIIDNMRQFFADMKTAANDDTQKKALVSKYDDWLQVPFLMTPNNTIEAIKKSSETH